MDEHIINSFIFKNINQVDNIFNYVKKHSSIDDISLNDVSKCIQYLVKTNILVHNLSQYSLTSNGQLVLYTNITYYKRIIKRFFVRIRRCRSCKKQFEFKEKRLEQSHLRDHLIKTKSHTCILCDKNLPLCLLETAHIKPRCILSEKDLYDTNLVEFMCRYCHTLYDNGLLGIQCGLLKISSKLEMYTDVSYLSDKHISAYNKDNSHYFDFHFKNIFIK
jgi:hypothetical protein